MSGGGGEEGEKKTKKKDENETKMSVINVKFETIVKSSKNKIKTKNESLDYITII